ncbi:MAG: tetratricopeptide repeat protein [Opitutales bacterium]|nr:tetratricopeptide repeat protein [Opitutales bacterium]
MKNRLLAFVTLFLALSLPVLADELPERVARFEQMLLRSPGPGSAFDEVRSHFQREESLTALQERWENALAETPSEAATYHFLLGLLADERRQPREAREHLQKATEANPLLGPAWSALADLLLREGALDEAIAAYEKAIEQPLAPREEQEILLALGRVHLRLFDTEAAIETWQNLREQYSDDPFVLEEIGEALLQAGAFAEARKTLGMLIENPDTDAFRRLQANLWVADTHLRQGQWDEALDGYAKVFHETQPGSWLQRQALSKVEDLFFRRGQTEELLTFYQEALEQNRNLYLARRLQQLYERLHRPEEANDLLRQMARWAPDDPRVQADRARLYQEEGDWEAAEDLLLTLTRRHSQEWSYRESLGELYLERAHPGDRQKAADTWADLAPEEITDPGPVIRLGDLYRRYQWNDEALETYQRALSLETRNFALREKIALFLFDLERHGEGWEILRGSGEDLPSASNYHRLARLEYRHDLVGEALESIQKGLALDETHFPLLRFKWQVHSEQESWEEALAIIPAMQENLPNEFHQPNVDRLHRLSLEQTGRFEETLEDLRKTFASSMESDAPMELEDLRFFLYMESSEKDLEELTEILQQGLAWHPEAFPLVHQQWELARSANDLDLQEESLRQLIEIRPSRTGEWLRHLSQAFRSHGDAERAREVAREWVAYQPADSSAHLFLADLFYEYGQHEEGNQIIEQALALASDTVPLRRRMAEALSRQGRMEEALEAHRENFQTLTSRSDRLGLIPEMVEVYRRAGFPEPMDEWFSRHFPDLRETADGHLYRGEIFLEQEDYTAARQELERAWALEPSNLNIADSLVRLALEEENFDEAVRHGRDAFAIDSSVENEMRLANLLLHTEETSEAFAIIARNGDHFVRHTQEWPEFFALLRTTANRDQLVQIIQNHLTTTEDPFEAQIALAEFFIEQGDFPQAWEILWELYQQEPEEDIGLTSAGTGGWSGMYDSGVFAEYQITRQAIESFASRIVNNHPLYQQQHHHSFSHHSYFQQTSMPDINEYRSQALGYLVSIAIVQNEEESFLAQWNQMLQGQATHRILVEKLKIDHFDDLFQETLRAVAEGELSLHPHWEDSLYQLLQIYSMQGLFANISTEVSDDILDSLSTWGERTRSGIGAFSTMMKLQEWWQQLEMGNFSQDKEKVFAELDEFIEELGDDLDMRFHLDFVGVQLALGYEDFERALSRFHALDVGGTPYASYYLHGILSQGLEALISLNRPFEEAEKKFLQAMLGDERSMANPFGNNFPHFSDVNEMRLPFHASETIPSDLINNLHRLRNSQKQHDQDFAWERFFQPTEEVELSPAQERHFQILAFFFALWDEDYPQVRSLGQTILASGEDAGIRLNLAYLYEKEGNIQQALSLLDGAQMNRNEWFGANQWKIIQLASTDEAYYPIGQMAVRRLARNWERQHRHRLGNTLEELHLKVGMAEEWERRQEQQKALEETTSEASRTPHWKVLLEEWKESEDEKEKISLAKEVLRHAPLGYREPSIRQNRSLHFGRTSDIRTLRSAKEDTLRFLLLAGEWEDYIDSLRQRAEDNPSSLDALARLIEALEFTNHETTHRHGRAHPRTPEDDPRVEMRLRLTEDALVVENRPVNQERWNPVSHLQHDIYQGVYGRTLKVGLLLSGGAPGQSATIEIENPTFLTTDGEELPLETLPLAPSGGKAVTYSREEITEGRLRLTSDGGLPDRRMSPHGLFLGAESDRLSEFRFIYNPLDNDQDNGGHLGLMVQTLDESIEQLFFYSAHVFGDRMFTYTRIETITDPAPYYRQAIALRPSNEYFREAFAATLHRQDRFAEIIEFFEDQVRENPYLVLRGDDSRLETAYHKMGKIPGLVDEFLQHPALRFNLSQISQHQNQLGQILEEVGENLAELGYPVEAARVRGLALEILPVTETMEARISLLDALSKEGSLDSARSLLHGFFETSEEKEESLILMSQRHRFEPDEGNWLDHFDAWHHYHNNRLPYPFRLIQAAHPDLVVEYHEIWRERNPDFTAIEDPAEALLGAILHWALAHPDFPQALLAVGRNFGPNARLSTQRKEWFQRTFHFPLLESLPAFPTEEETREALFTAFGGSSEGRQGGLLQRMFGGGQNTSDSFLKYRTALLIKGMDHAWEHQEKVFEEIISQRNHLHSDRLAYTQTLVREAVNRLEAEAVEDLIQQLMDSSNFARNDQQKNALRWEQERLHLRRGEVRKPYATAFLVPPSKEGEEPILHYAISSIHPEDSYHNESTGRRARRSWFYGETFPLLDGKFDLTIEYPSRENESETLKVTLPATASSGEVTLPDAAARGTILLSLKDAESGEEVFTMNQQNFPFQPPPSVLPPLLGESPENADGITWEWLGVPPRLDSLHHYAGEDSVFFAGTGNENNEIARSSLIPLGDHRRVTIQTLMKHRSTHPNPFVLVFYNENGEEVFQRTPSLRSNPERWIISRADYERATGASRSRNQIPREATHVRVIIRANTPLNIADLSLFLFSK